MRYDQKYKNYTLVRLILENYLRPVPLKMSALTAYAGHKYGGLRTAKNRLKRDGRIRDNITVVDHPDNIAMSLVPLEDMRLLPKPYSKVNEKAAKEARIVAAEALGLTTEAMKSKRLSDEQVKDILSSHIIAGGGGKDFIPAINAYLAFGATKEPLGLPAPLTPEETTVRLIRCLASAPPESAEAAIARWRAGEGAPAAPDDGASVSAQGDPEALPEPSLDVLDPTEDTEA